jgi:hypothetical protein
MKTIQTTLIIAVFFALSAMNVKGQNQQASGSDQLIYALGLGSTYGFGIEQFGINVNFFVSSFDYRYQIGTDVTFYLADSKLELNLNLHHIILRQEALRVYVLAGLQVATRDEVDTDSFDDEDDSPLRRLLYNIKINAFNAGASIEYDIGSIMLFAEPKYSFGKIQQPIATIGIRIRL